MLPDTRSQAPLARAQNLAHYSSNAGSSGVVGRQSSPYSAR